MEPLEPGSHLLPITSGRLSPYEPRRELRPASPEAMRKPPLTKEQKRIEELETIVATQQKALVTLAQQMQQLIQLHKNLEERLTAATDHTQTEIGVLARRVLNIEAVQAGGDSVIGAKPSVIASAADR